MGPRLTLVILITAFGFAAVFAALTTMRQINVASSALTSHARHI